MTLKPGNLFLKTRHQSCLSLAGRLLHDRSLGPEVRVKTLNVLAVAALKDDVILLLHQDRREHVLMNYAGDVERLTQEEQLSLSLMVRNLEFPVLKQFNSKA